MSPVMYLHAVVRDGQVIGHWRRVAETSARADPTIEATFRKPLDRDARRALQEEVERYGRFLQGKVRLTFAKRL
jgi:hypothetical protein